MEPMLIQHPTHSSFSKTVRMGAFIGLFLLVSLFANSVYAGKIKVIQISKVTNNSAFLRVKNPYPRGFRIRLSLGIYKAKRAEVIDKPKRKKYFDRRHMTYTHTVKRLKSRTKYVVMVYLWRGSRVLKTYKKAFKTLGKVVAIAYKHTHFRGKSIKLYKGQNIKRLSSRGWNDDISSIKIYGKKTRVYFYQHKNYKGKRLKITRSIRKLSKKGWNDKASSLRAR